MSLADRLGRISPPPTWTRRPEILLCANTVKPMHGVVPRVILGKDWWDKTRQEAYRSTNYHCIACGVSKWEAKEHKWLEGHELYETDYLIGRMTYIETVPLCHYCHNFIHNGRLEQLLAAGEITQEKFTEVMSHGSQVLRDAGITKKTGYRGKIAEWGKWRLILLGKEYPPLYKTYKDWLAHFNPTRES